MAKLSLPVPSKQDESDHPSIGQVVVEHKPGHGHLRKHIHGIGEPLSWKCGLQKETVEHMIFEFECLLFNKGLRRKDR